MEQISPLSICIDRWDIYIDGIFGWCLVKMILYEQLLRWSQRVHYVKMSFWAAGNMEHLVHPQQEWGFVNTKSGLKARRASNTYEHSL